MPKVIAFEDVRHRAHRERGRVRTDFFYTPETPDLPMAYLHQGDPGRITNVHWHENDQFQIVVEGEGTLGRHKVSPYTAQFVRAYTPYGPIVGSEQTGVSYISLLTHYDPVANYLPESRDALLRIPERHPWQKIRHLDLVSGTQELKAGAIEMQAVAGMADEQGLRVWSLVMGAGAGMTTPDARRSAGQYVLGLTGSLVYGDKAHGAYTVVFVEPEAASFDLHAGPHGLKAVIVNFPRHTD